MTFAAFSNEDQNSLISHSHITIANAKKMSDYMNLMGCKTQMQLERIGVLNKWTRPRSACTEGDHAHDGNALADIDTIASCKDSPQSSKQMDGCF